MEPGKVKLYHALKLLPRGREQRSIASCEQQLHPPCPSHGGGFNHALQKAAFSPSDGSKTRGRGKVGQKVGWVPEVGVA